MSTTKELKITVRAVHGRCMPSQFPSENPEAAMVRRRLKTLSVEEAENVHPVDGPDNAYFVPGQGLVGHDMYHTNYFIKDYVMEDRSVLVQSLETYLQLLNDERVGVYFEKHYAAETEEETIELVLENTCFGEQLIVQGCVSGDVCIGDVFADTLGDSTLQLEVTSPRYPCNVLDRKVGSVFGEKGVRRHALNVAGAGWFCRVLKEGKVVDGMTLTRTLQPHPQWPLTRACDALYGKHGSRMQYLSCKPVWGESLQALEEFAHLKQLGGYEWGDEAWKILEKRKEEARLEQAAMDEAESWCSSPFASATSSVAACACLSPVLLSMLFTMNEIFAASPERS